MHRPASWYRTSERHFAADLGRVGGLMVWLDAATGTWSVSVLGTQRTGFITAAAAQAAALRLARAQLEEGLRRIGELEPAAAAGDVRA
jgi:ornithine cyclodeaminase/alanine dehydrogenase-like protein (mu-crystallin family)